MSEHDPLCPWEFQHDCECGCPRTAFECKCDEYAAVRSDEREKAAQRVKDLRKPSPTFHVAAMQNAYDTGVIEAIAAVRGES